VLDRPYADLFAGAKLPGPEPIVYEGYTMPVAIINGQWLIGRGGSAAGSVANWNIYPDTGWVGVVLCNHDGNSPIQEICLKEAEAVTGQPVDPPGGGG
jgi:hypothetical protein